MNYLVPMNRFVGVMVAVGALVPLAACAPQEDAPLDLVQGRMAVVPFDTDGDAALGEVAAALEEAVVAAAAGVDGAEVVRLSQSEDVSGAAMILRGSITRTGDEVVVDAEIVDPTDEARRHALPEERASASDPSTAVSRIASRAAAALAAHQDPDWTAPWYYTIPTLESYRIAKRGDSLFAQYKQDESLPFFYEAYAADTMYLSPLFAAAAVHGNMGRPTLRDSILDHIEARADLLTELEHFNIPWYRGTPEEALAAAKGAAALDPLGWTYAVGFRANWAGHFREAVEWLSRRPQLVERGSYWARTWTPFRSQYMMALHAVGDHETELAEAQQTRVDFADNPWWIWSEMRARAALGQVEAVRAQYDTTVTLLETNEDASYWENLEDIATELKVHGNPDAGQALMETVVAHYREVGNTVQLGDALGFAGRPQEAYQTLAPLMDEDPSVDVIGWYGAAAAISGETAQAEQTLARLEGHATAATGNNLRYQAAIQGALGHCDRAIELYRQATEAGFAYHQAWGGEWWHRDWDTEPVRANCPLFPSLLDKG